MFSIDLSGRWSEIQSVRVIEVVQPEAMAMGLYVSRIDVTVHNDAIRWYVLVVEPLDRVATELFRQ